MALACALPALAGCSKREPPPEPPPPVEAVLAVTSEDAPLLNELEDDEPAAQVVHRGDLLLPGTPRPAFPSAWKATMEGRAAERRGPMLEVRQAPGDAVLYGFSADLGEPSQAPPTSYLCARMAAEPGLGAAAARPECPGLLRRSRLPDGALVAFTPCASGPCPIGLLRGGALRAIAVDGITAARVVPTEAGPALLAVSRYNREEGRLTGGALVPVALSGSAPIALAPIPIDEIDARDPKVVKARMVRAELSWPSPGRTAVHLIGDRRETVLADGRELSRTPIDETLVLPGR